MGKAARRKWIVRAEVFEEIVQKGSPDLSRAYAERFSRKLHKLAQGAGELAEERVEEAMEEAHDDESEG